MKKITGHILSLLCIILVFMSLSGCGTVAKVLLNRASSDQAGTEDTEKAQEEDKEDSESSSGKKKHKTKKNKDKDKDEDEITEDIYKENADEVFAEMADWMFIFSSGAGGWGTELFVKPDGSFSGRYSDSDMGSTGPGYEYGTVYQCDFSGRFSKDVRSAGPLMHSLKIESIEYEKKPETEEIIDNIKYVYTGPYGIEGLDKETGYDAPLVFMEAGAVTSALNEEELSWVSMNHFGCSLGEDRDYVEDVPEELPYAVLLNNVDEYAFFAENISEKSKTRLVNRVKIPGLRNTKLTINDDGTYYCVDENKDGTFKVINTCFKTSKAYDTYEDGEALVKDSLKEIYQKNAPDADEVYVTSPKEAYSMQYPQMAVNGEYTVYSFWTPKGYDKHDQVYRDGRFLAINGYQSDGAFVYAYIIESEKLRNDQAFPDAAFANYYISSLALTGRDDRISSAGEGKGAIRDINCTMHMDGSDAVAAKELVMVGSGDTELIKKYHLENASFDDDYEIVAVDDDYRSYKLADGGSTPFYVQYPEDGFHRLRQAFELDEYINRFGNGNDNENDNTCLMYLYLNADDEVVYGFEEYTP